MRKPPSFNDTLASGNTPEQDAAFRRQLTFKVIQGVNAEFLERLCEGAQARAAHFPFGEAVRSSLLKLSDADRLKLSQIGVLLVDTCFALSQNWRSAITEARAQGAGRSMAAPHWLSAKDGLLSAYSTMHGAWSVLLWNRTDAEFLLGITPDTAKLIELLTVKDLVRIAEMKSHWVQPRWAEHPGVWLDLIARTLANDPSATLGVLALSARLPGHTQAQETVKPR